VTQNCRLALAYAHPDDDVWANAGTLALEEGRLSTTVLLATDRCRSQLSEAGVEPGGPTLGGLVEGLD
jgi:hypothetical protein